MPTAGVINPLQAGAIGDGSTNDRDKVQESIDFIDHWNTTTTGSGAPGLDSDRSAITLVIPANKRFRIDTTVGDGLQLKGPITIEGEDRDTSRLFLFDSTTSTSDMIKATNKNRLTFRNFTMEGSYIGALGSDGLGQLVKFDTVDGVLLENVTLTRNRAVIVGGDWVRNLVMRGCLLSESRNGGLVINNVENITIVDNDFRWVPDDPVALTISDATATPPYRNDGGAIRVIGNRCFGTRGININGAKNVIVAANTHTLGRGRAIHIGTTTFQQKGDTSTLNIIVQGNIITDLLDAKVDPRFPEDATGGHRAIDIEMPFAAPGAAASNIPGLPGSGYPILDPTPYYYTYEQSAQGVQVWQPGLFFPRPDGSLRTWWDGRFYKTTAGGTTGSNPPTGATTTNDGGVDWIFDGWEKATPHSGNILIEGNIISRSRPPAVAVGQPGHIDPFINFQSYNVGKYGGDAIGYPNTYNANEITVPLDYITPREGIAVTGSVRNLIIRGNQVRNCDTAISFEGDKLTLPFSLLDVTIVDNDLVDWKTAGMRFYDYDTYSPPASYVPRQRVSILNNRADGDPSHWNRLSEVRKANGKWADTTNRTNSGPPPLPSTPIPAGYASFIDATGLGLATIAGNHVRNVAQLIAGLDNARHAVEGNVAYCNPADVADPALDVGYNPDNIGIGKLIAPQLGWRYVIEDGDPASPDYGKLLNPCPLALPPTAAGTLPKTSSIPTPRWVKGTIVANLNPAKLGPTGGLYYEIWSWRRIRTGTGDVLDTDWRPLKLTVL